jgi:CBS domain-containing protein
VRNVAARIVSDLMTESPVVVSPETPLTDAAALMEFHRISGLPVVDGFGEVVGVISETDLVHAWTSKELWERRAEIPVGTLMSQPAVTVPPGMDLVEAARMLEWRQIHRLVVVDRDGRTPIGILSATDLMEAMLPDDA